MNARFHCNRHICITRAGNALSLIASDQSHRFVLTLSVSAASERQNTIHLTKMQALLKQNTRIISRGWELGARDFPTAAKVNKKRHVHQDSRSFVTLVGGEKIARILPFKKVGSQKRNKWCRNPRNWKKKMIRRVER